MLQNWVHPFLRLAAPPGLQRGAFPLSFTFLLARVLSEFIFRPHETHSFPAWVVFSVKPGVGDSGSLSAHSFVVDGAYGRRYGLSFSLSFPPPQIGALFCVLAWHSFLFFFLPFERTTAFFSSSPFVLLADLLSIAVARFFPLLAGRSDSLYFFFTPVPLESKLLSGIFSCGC